MANTVFHHPESRWEGYLSSYNNSLTELDATQATHGYSKVEAAEYKSIGAANLKSNFNSTFSTIGDHFKGQCDIATPRNEAFDRVIEGYLKTKGAIDRFAFITELDFLELKK